MWRGVQMFGGPMLFVSLMAVTACDHRSSSATAPSMLAVQSAASVVLSADPAALRFEPMADSECGPVSSQGVRLVVIVTGGEGTSLRGLRFGFVPDGGTTIFPSVIPIPGPSPMSVPANAIPPQTPLPTLGVAPLPTSMPIPLPQPQRLPFFASLGCGVPGDGVLVVTADVVDRLGVAGTSELRARVTH